jgi:hypothetical protein
MAEATTHDAYISSIDDTRRADVRALHELVRQIAPHLVPTMEFGMPGYGKYHYKYESGREGDWALILLESQRSYISLYVTAMTEDGNQYLAESYADKLGKVKVGKSCIKFNRFVDVDRSVLENLLAEAATRPPYPLSD